MSCVIDDVLAPSPALEVAELSQICEGLARQRRTISRRCFMQWR